MLYNTCLNIKACNQSIYIYWAFLTLLCRSLYKKLHWSEKGLKQKKYIFLPGKIRIVYDLKCDIIQYSMFPFFYNKHYH